MLFGRTRRLGSSQQSWNSQCFTVTLFSPLIYLLISQKKPNKKKVYFFYPHPAASYPTLQVFSFVLFLIILSSPHAAAGTARWDCALVVTCNHSVPKQKMIKHLRNNYSVWYFCHSSSHSVLCRCWIQYHRCFLPFFHVCSMLKQLIFDFIRYIFDPSLSPTK